MIHIFSVSVPFAQLSQANSGIAFLQFVNTVFATLWITGFLCILNIGLALFYRKRRIGEVVSYYIVCAAELAVFVFALLLHLGVVTRVPYPLPPGLPFNRAEIGATIAIGLGLLPATYWHRISISEMGTRIAQDAQTMKDHDGGVRIGRKSSPNEWMN